MPRGNTRCTLRVLGINAPVELLTEKGVLTEKEILERIESCGLKQMPQSRTEFLETGGGVMKQKQSSIPITYIAPKVYYCPACHFVVVRTEPTFPLHLECSNGKTKTGEPECQSSVRFR